MAKIDDVPSLRPRLLPPLRWLLVFAGIPVVLVGAFFLAKSCSEAHRQRAFAAAREADARDDAIASQIADRLARLRRATPPTAPAETCPQTVKGKLPLVEKPVLDWFVDGGGYETRPKFAFDLRSPVFHYLEGSWTPSIEAPKDFESRHARYLELASARYIAVVTGEVTPVKTPDPTTFEGGTVDVILAIGDVESGQFVCACRVTSQPMGIVWLGQTSADGNRWAARHATEDAVVDAFVTEARARLATMAPNATLLTK